MCASLRLRRIALPDGALAQGLLARAQHRATRTSKCGKVAIETQVGASDPSLGCRLRSTDHAWERERGSEDEARGPNPQHEVTEVQSAFCVSFVYEYIDPRVFFFNLSWVLIVFLEIGFLFSNKMIVSFIEACFLCQGTRWYSS